MYILGFESSCDETAVAVMQVTCPSDMKILSNEVVSQVPVHRLYGGVVPEIASRAHIEAISPLTRRALEGAGVSLADISLVAVTSNPGLIGALLVGVNFAKSLAAASSIPLVAVNHMKAHIAASYACPKELCPPEPPYMALAVSGGHTSLYMVHSYTDFEEIGATRDDAIGEAFDKVGRLLGLTYPAGAAFDSLAARGYAALGIGSVLEYENTEATRSRLYRLPSPALCDGTFDFSYSGLKTAAVNQMHNLSQTGEEPDRPLFAAAYTYAAVHAVCVQCEAALKAYPVKTLAVAGGVAANTHLRTVLSDMCRRMGVRLAVPAPALCGDNAAMVCAQGFHEFTARHTSGPSLNACAADLL